MSASDWPELRGGINMQMFYSSWESSAFLTHHVQKGTANPVAMPKIPKEMVEDHR